MVWGLSVAVSLLAALFVFAEAEDPYLFLTWNVTYGIISPLGVSQQGILINGQFPGPDIRDVTNANIIVNVHNSLDEPFLVSWNGLQNRKNSYQDGMVGTTCPIPPFQNFTYKLQLKDQIGTFFYFPSLSLHKAAGGFGGISILNRSVIPIPFEVPDADVTILIGDWYSSNHTDLKAILDGGQSLPAPDAILINGYGPNNSAFTINVDQGKTYRLRLSNVGMDSSLNLRIEGHNMTLVEVEGTYTQQIQLSSLDLHVGQSCSVLVTANQPPKDYSLIVSTRFAKRALNSTATFHYINSNGASSGPLPDGPLDDDIQWSLNQARSIRSNLSVSGPRPNPQGSFHYGNITITRTIILANSNGSIFGKLRYALNSVSFVVPDDGTPLKLADYYKIPGVFEVGSIPYTPNGLDIHNNISVMNTEHREFVEFVFQNNENTIQSYHINGYQFHVVGMGPGQWTNNDKTSYNLRDAIARSTTQVYPESWTAILVSLDNVGMWNVRSEHWGRQYLGQQFYLRVHTNSTSLRDENHVPDNALKCGRAVGQT